MEFEYGEGWSTDEDREGGGEDADAYGGEEELEGPYGGAGAEEGGPMAYLGSGVAEAQGWGKDEDDVKDEEIEIVDGGVDDVDDGGNDVDEEGYDVEQEGHDVDEGGQDVDEEGHDVEEEGHDVAGPFYEEDEEFDSLGEESPEREADEEGYSPVRAHLSQEWSEDNNKGGFIPLAWDSPARQSVVSPHTAPPTSSSLRSTLSMESPWPQRSLAWPQRPWVQPSQSHSQWTQPTPAYQTYAHNQGTPSGLLQPESHPRDHVGIHKTQPELHDKLWNQLVHAPYDETHSGVAHHQWPQPSYIQHATSSRMLQPSYTQQHETQPGAAHNHHNPSNFSTHYTPPPSYPPSLFPNPIPGSTASNCMAAYQAQTLYSKTVSSRTAAYQAHTVAQSFAVYPPGSTAYNATAANQAHTLAESVEAAGIRHSIPSSWEGVPDGNGHGAPQAHQDAWARGDRLSQPRLDARSSFSYASDPAMSSGGTAHLRYTGASPGDSSPDEARYSTPGAHQQSTGASAGAPYALDATMHLATGAGQRCSNRSLGLTRQYRTHGNPNEEYLPENPGYERALQVSASPAEDLPEWEPRMGPHGASAGRDLGLEACGEFEEAPGYTEDWGCEDEDLPAWEGAQGFRRKRGAALEQEWDTVVARAPPIQTSRDLERDPRRQLMRAPPAKVPRPGEGTRKERHPAEPGLGSNGPASRSAHGLGADRVSSEVAGACSSEGAELARQHPAHGRGLPGLPGLPGVSSRTKTQSMSVLEGDSDADHYASDASAEAEGVGGEEGGRDWDMGGGSDWDLDGMGVPFILALPAVGSTHRMGRQRPRPVPAPASFRPDMTVRRQGTRIAAEAGERQPGSAALCQGLKRLMRKGGSEEEPGTNARSALRGGERQQMGGPGDDVAGVLGFEVEAVEPGVMVILALRAVRQVDPIVEGVKGGSKPLQRQQLKRAVVGKKREQAALPRKDAIVIPEKVTNVAAPDWLLEAAKHDKIDTSSPRFQAALKAAAAKAAKPAPGSAGAEAAAPRPMLPGPKKDPHAKTATDALRQRGMPLGLAQKLASQKGTVAKAGVMAYEQRMRMKRKWEGQKECSTSVAQGPISGEGGEGQKAGAPRPAGSLYPKGHSSTPQLENNSSVMVRVLQIADSSLAPRTNDELAEGTGSKQVAQAGRAPALIGGAHGLGTRPSHGPPQAPNGAKKGLGPGPEGGAGAKDKGAANGRGAGDRSKGGSQAAAAANVGPGGRASGAHSAETRARELLQKWGVKGGAGRGTAGTEANRRAQTANGPGAGASSGTRSAFALQAQLPDEMRPQIRLNIHSRIPTSMRQLALCRWVEHHLRVARPKVIGRNPECEAAIAAAVTSEKEVFAASGAKQVYQGKTDRALAEAQESARAKRPSKASPSTPSPLANPPSSKPEACSQSGKVPASAARGPTLAGGISASSASAEVPARAAVAAAEVPVAARVAAALLATGLEDEDEEEDEGEPGSVGKAAAENADEPGMVNGEMPGLEGGDKPELKHGNRPELENEDKPGLRNRARPGLEDGDKPGVVDRPFLENEPRLDVQMEPEGHVGPEGRMGPDVQMEPNEQVESRGGEEAEAAGDQVALCAGADGLGPAGAEAPVQDDVILCASAQGGGELGEMPLGSGAMQLEAGAGPASGAPDSFKGDKVPEAMGRASEAGAHREGGPGALGVEAGNGVGRTGHGSAAEGARELEGHKPLPGNGRVEEDGASMKMRGEGQPSLLEKVAPSLVLLQVEAFVRTHLKPLEKSGVICTEQRKWAAHKSAAKVMQKHVGAPSADFLIAEGDSVRRLSEKYVEIWAGLHKNT